MALPVKSSRDDNSCRRLPMMRSRSRMAESNSVQQAELSGQAGWDIGTRNAEGHMVCSELTDQIERLKV